MVKLLEFFFNSQYMLLRDSHSHNQRNSGALLIFGHNECAILEMARLIAEFTTAGYHDERYWREKGLGTILLGPTEAIFRTAVSRVTPQELAKSKKI